MLYSIIIKGANYMKKRFFSFILAFALFIPCMFALTACGKEPRPFVVQIVAPDELIGVNPVAMLGDVDGPDKIDASTTGGTGELKQGESKTYAVYVFDDWDVSTLKILKDGENIFNLDNEFSFGDTISDANFAYKAGTLTIDNIQENVNLNVEVEARKIEVKVKFTDSTQNLGNKPAWANDLYFIDYNNNEVMLSQVWGYTTQEYYTVYISCLDINASIPLYCKKPENYYHIPQLDIGLLDDNDNPIYSQMFIDGDCGSTFSNEGNDEIDPFSGLSVDGFFDGESSRKDSITLNLTAIYNGQETIIIQNN